MEIFGAFCPWSKMLRAGACQFIGEQTVVGLSADFARYQCSLRLGHHWRTGLQ